MMVHWRMRPRELGSTTSAGKADLKQSMPSDGSFAAGSREKAAGEAAEEAAGEQSCPLCSREPANYCSVSVRL